MQKSNKSAEKGNYCTLYPPYKITFDLLEEDGNWGIETFSRAVLYLEINKQFCKGARCNAQGAKINQPRCKF